MDPRTAAKVTAPDLLKAFTEGTGQPVDDEAVSDMKAWVIFTNGDDVVSMTVYPLDRLEVAMYDAIGHLRSGDDVGVMFFVGTEEPPIVDDARQAISDGSGE